MRTEATKCQECSQHWSFNAETKSYSASHHNQNHTETEFTVIFSAKMQTTMRSSSTKTSMKHSDVIQSHGKNSFNSVAQYSKWTALQNIVKTVQN